VATTIKRSRPAKSTPPVAGARPCRTLFNDIGWQDVPPHVHNGNILFAAEGTISGLEKQLAEAIAGRFGHRIHVIVCPAADWPLNLRLNPFREASETERNCAIPALARNKLPPGNAENLQQFATAGESVAQRAASLSIHYASGPTRPKLTPAPLDRLVSQPDHPCRTR
jgi:uncharacterized protein (DUF1697 family)